MAEIHSEYNGDLLHPEQIAELDGALRADLDAMAAEDEAEPEAGG